MCKGEQVYFYCPRSIAGDVNCPYYQFFGNPPFTYYMVLTRETEWECCGHCGSVCMECVNIELRGRVMDTVECDPCLARIQAEAEQQAQAHAQAQHQPHQADEDSDADAEGEDEQPGELHQFQGYEEEEEEAPAEPVQDSDQDSAQDQVPLVDPSFDIDEFLGLHQH